MRQIISRSIMMKCLSVITALLIAGGLSPCTGKEKARFGGKDRIESGFRGEIFHIPVGTRKLQQVKWQNPVGVIYTKELNVPKTDFREGFPGITDRFEWFAIRYTATFTVLDEGTYRFKLRSDDGSILYIDGKKIIDNDGAHSAKQRKGKVRLSPGKHDIRVDYFQGPRYDVALELRVDPPYGSYVHFRPDLPLGRGDGPFGSIFGSHYKFAGELYAVDRNFRVEDMGQLRRSLGTLYTNTLDVREMRWKGGFPFLTERSEYFAIRYSAEFSVPLAGSYRFSLHADDGAMLYIDGALVIDNGGMHPPRTRARTIHLDEGDHTIQVDYFQAEDRVALQLGVTPPHGQEMTFEPGALAVAVPEPPTVTGTTGTSVATAGATLVAAQSLVDFVSQAAVFKPDGFPDVFVKLSVPVPAGSVRTIEVINTDGFPSFWDTDPGNTGWALAVIKDGLRQNQPDGSISFYHIGGTLDLDLYFQDNGSVSAGLTHYQVNLVFSDGQRYTLPVIRH